MLLYSETPNLHTHTLKVAIVHAADYDGRVRRSTCSAARSRAGCTCSIRCATDSSTSRGDCTIRCGWRTAPSTSTTTCAGCRCPRPGGRRELDEVIGEIASTPLDRTKPLWEFHFAEGMADDRFALIGKVHHTLADGVASANLLARLMDLSGSAQDEQDDYVTVRPALEAGVALGGTTRPLPSDGGAAGPGEGCGPGYLAAAATLEGAQRPSRPGQDVQDAADLPQSRGVAGADVRHRVAVAGRGQGDRQAARRDVQRHHPGDGCRRTARTAVALRRTGRPTADGVGAGQHRTGPRIASPATRSADCRCRFPSTSTTRSSGCD